MQSSESRVVNPDGKRPDDMMEFFLGRGFKFKLWRCLSLSGEYKRLSDEWKQPVYCNGADKEPGKAALLGTCRIPLFNNHRRKSFAVP